MREAKRVLVANELASYRESLAAALRYALPDVEVSEATSAELNREVLRVRPDLVVCSRVTSLVRERVPNWVELYPDRGGPSTFCFAGELSTEADVNLDDLISAVKRARKEARSA